MVRLGGHVIAPRGMGAVYRRESVHPITPEVIEMISCILIIGISHVLEISHEHHQGQVQRIRIQCDARF